MLHLVHSFQVSLNNLEKSLKSLTLKTKLFTETFF